LVLEGKGHVAIVPGKKRKKSTAWQNLMSRN